MEARGEKAEYKPSQNSLPLSLLVVVIQVAFFGPDFFKPLALHDELIHLIKDIIYNLSLNNNIFVLQNIIFILFHLLPLSVPPFPLLPKVRRFYGFAISVKRAESLFLLFDTETNNPSNNLKSTTAYLPESSLPLRVFVNQPTNQPSSQPFVLPFNVIRSVPYMPLHP